MRLHVISFIGSTIVRNEPGLYDMFMTLSTINRAVYYHAPYTYNEPVYEKRRQMAPDLDEPSYLSPRGIK